MNCTESQDILQRRLDGDAIPDRAALDQHLGECADCRLLHAAAGQLEIGLRKVAQPLPPPGLRTSIVAAALKDRARHRRRRLVVGIALAASLLLAVGLALPVPDGLPNEQGLFGRYRQAREYVAGVFWPQPTKRGIWLPVAPVDLAMPSPGRPVNAPSLRDSMAEAGTAVVSLTWRTADQTVEQTRILSEVLPMPTNVFEAVPPMPDQPIANAWQETSQRVATGFEPVTNSARRALSMLLRENPRAVNQ